MIVETRFSDVRPDTVYRRLSLKGTGHRALRHARASPLIAAGESVKVVSARLGHTNAAMPPNVYSRLFPEPEERTGAAVGRAFGALTGECAPDVPPRPEG